MNARQMVIALAGALVIVLGGEVLGGEILGREVLGGQVVEGTDCSGFTPSFGLVRQTVSIEVPRPLVDGYIFADSFGTERPLLRWADIFGSDFPARNSDYSTTRIASGKFVALAFTTGTRGDPIYGGSDLGSIEMASSQGGNGIATLSFSACPGDFSTQPAPNPCWVSFGAGQFVWKLGGVEPFACVLAENITYYLNVAFVDMPGGQNTCTSPKPGTSDYSCRFSAQAR